MYRNESSFLIDRVGTQQPDTNMAMTRIADNSTNAKTVSSTAPPASISTDTVVQDFWLHNLLEADGITEWVVDEISPWLGSQVLEVGCGIGTYTVKFAAKSQKVTAIDMEQVFAEETARRVASLANVQVIAGDVTNASDPLLNREGFDSVVLLDVLEHIEFDVDLLTRLRSKLKVGGHLIVKVPAMPSLYSPMDAAIGHWRRYDKRGLVSTIRRAGFEAVDVWSFNALAILGWWWNGRIVKRTAPPAGQIALFNSLTPIIRRFDKLARLICGSSLIAIGQRPAARRHETQTVRIKQK
jgi:2-polyprenyl-3-methyl-5-hydroxy-6-metoxy-1,4-benzoquinol methylase